VKLSRIVLITVILITAVVLTIGLRSTSVEIPQTGSIISFGGYDWRVLDVQKDRALIISDNLLEKRAFNNQNTSATWETCDLRRYLNGEFYDQFSAEAKTRIMETRIQNNPNPWFDIKGGKETNDRIFLLNIEEVVQYFGDSGQLRNKYQDNKYWIEDQYNSSRIAKYADGKASWWWLRSPGRNNNRAIYILDFGFIDISGGFYNRDDGGVRPALWLKL
jgi:hypothetical protein